MFIHLSHTDLDGYGCQFLTKEYFKEGLFFNANYGLEVKLSLEKILEEMNNNLDQEIFFLISDLNLTYNESKKLNNDINKLNENGANIKLQLLDHHGSGQKSADKFEWYFLDTSRCATKIVYDYINTELDGFGEQRKNELNPLVDAINAVDIWLEDQVESFEFGKVCMRLINKASEVNSALFADLNRDYRIYLLNEAAQYVSRKNGNILLDNEIHFIKKRYLQKNEQDNTIDNLAAQYLVEILGNKKEDLTVTYKEHKGLLTFSLGSISIPANAFLKANDDYDFFIDISRKGNASFRADGVVDVSVLAAKMADGGGHPNASGARFHDFKETIIYDNIKKFIQEKLKRCE